MKKRGVPLSQFSSKLELLSGLRDNVQAHLELVRAGILHRDIHDKNVMLDANEFWDSGVRKGLLIDLNYACFLDDLQDEMNRIIPIGLKSCPAPFVACDLLGKPEYARHEPHHDLESFLYVLMWIAFCYSGPNGHVRTDRPFDIKSKIGKWVVGEDLETLGALKAFHMQPDPSNTDSFVNFLEENFTPYFHDLTLCVCDLRSVIMRKVPRATHEEVIKILDEHIARLSPDPAELADPDDIEPDYDLGCILFPPPEDENAKCAQSKTVGACEEHAGSSRDNTLPSRKRRATVCASPNLISRTGCPTCGKIALESQPDSIKCTAPDCSIPAYHIACVPKDQLHGDLGHWLCHGCLEDCTPLAKKPRMEDSTDRPSKCPICKKVAHKGHQDTIECAAPGCNEPNDRLEGIPGQWCCESCMDDRTPLSYFSKACKSGPGRRLMCQVCKTIVLEAAPDTIKCTGPDCKIRIFHHSCVPPQELGDDLGQWMCDTCDDDRPLGKKPADK